ncbi:MAG: DinB family protein [Terriglobia bacterium]
MKPEEFDRFFSTLDETSGRVRQITHGLDSKALTWKPSPEDFSILENVCHLRDIEAEGYNVRIEKLLTEEHPHLPDLDGSRLRRERNYNAQDLGAAVRGFQAARARSLKLLKGIKPAALEREGDLETVGRITLEELLLKMVEHDRGHIDEMTQLIDRLTERE